MAVRVIDGDWTIGGRARVEPGIAMRPPALFLPVGRLASERLTCAHIARVTPLVGRAKALTLRALETRAQNDANLRSATDSPWWGPSGEEGRLVRVETRDGRSATLVVVDRSEYARLMLLSPPDHAKRMH